MSESMTDPAPMDRGTDSFFNPQPGAGQGFGPSSGGGFGPETEPVGDVSDFLGAPLEPEPIGERVRVTGVTIDVTSVTTPFEAVRPKRRAAAARPKRKAARKKSAMPKARPAKLRPKRALARKTSATRKNAKSKPAKAAKRTKVAKKKSNAKKKPSRPAARRSKPARKKR